MCLYVYVGFCLRFLTRLKVEIKALNKAVTSSYPVYNATVGQMQDMLENYSLTGHALLLQAHTQRAAHAVQDEAEKRAKRVRFLAGEEEEEEDVPESAAASTAASTPSTAEAASTPSNSTAEPDVTGKNRKIKLNGLLHKRAGALEGGGELEDYVEMGDLDGGYCRFVMRLPPWHFSQVSVCVCV
jgi:hypothetical protein